MNSELSIEKVWEAWKLSDDAWELVDKGAREIPFSELFEKFFAQQPACGRRADQKTERQPTEHFSEVAVCAAI